MSSIESAQADFEAEIQPLVNKHANLIRQACAAEGKTARDALLFTAMVFANQYWQVIKASAAAGAGLDDLGFLARLNLITAIDAEVRVDLEERATTQ